MAALGEEIDQFSEMPVIMMGGIGQGIAHVSGAEDLRAGLKVIDPAIVQEFEVIEVPDVFLDAPLVSAPQGGVGFIHSLGDFPEAGFGAVKSFEDIEDPAFGEVEGEFAVYP